MLAVSLSTLLKVQEMESKLCYTITIIINTIMINSYFINIAIIVIIDVITIHDTITITNIINTELLFFDNVARGKMLKIDLNGEKKMSILKKKK